MGILRFLRKEKCITPLVTLYVMEYGCSDWKAIDVLRRNYTLEELQEVLDFVRRQFEGTTVVLPLLASELRQKGFFKE